MKTQLIRLLTALALCASLHRAVAQGTAFTYQGRLNNNTNPANGVYDFIFTVFNANSGGSIIGGPSTRLGVKGSVHENVMFSPDAVRSSERFTRAAASTCGREKSKFLSAKVKSCCSEGESPSSLRREAPEFSTKELELAIGEAISVGGSSK
jgi:hypothetical protein